MKNCFVKKVRKNIRRKAGGHEYISIYENLCIFWSADRNAGGSKKLPAFSQSVDKKRVYHAAGICLLQADDDAVGGAIGIVQTLVVTEKQFSKMEYVVGESKNDIVDSEERLVILWNLSIRR